MIDRSISKTLKLAAKRLSASSTAAVDAELLLMKALNVSRTLLFTWPERQLTEQELEAFEAFLVQREQGEPVAYIVGYRHFWTLELVVTSDVLIPRPETELMVEWVTKSFLDAHLKLAELGTGSGAIALSIASEKPGWEIVATDVSDAALSVAKQNAEHHEISNVSFKQGSWCSALDGEQYDIVVSNPPYIAPGDPHLCIGDVHHEPRQALVASHYGYSDLFRIITQAKAVLKPKGFLVLEHGFDQGEKVRNCLRGEDYQAIETINDLSNHERITIAQKGEA